MSEESSAALINKFSIDVLENIKIESRMFLLTLHLVDTH